MTNHKMTRLRCRNLSIKKLYKCGSCYRIFHGYLHAHCEPCLRKFEPSSQQA